MNRLNQVTTKTASPIKEITRESPTFAIQGVAASIALCLGMGLVMFLAVLGFAIWVEWKPEWRIAVGISSLFMGGLAIYWAFEGAEGIMWQVEKIIGQDIMIPDGYIGQPPLKPQHYVIDALRDDEGSSYTRKGLDGPENPKVLMAWIDAGLRQQSLAIEKWEQPFGYVYPRGTKTSVYMLFKAGAVSKGLLIDRGSHGIMLSNEGRHEFRQMLEQMRKEELPALTDGEDDK